MFKGSYEEYLAKRKSSLGECFGDIERQIFIYQLRLSEIMGRFSVPSKKEIFKQLDQDYHEELGELKRLKSLCM